MTRNDDANNMPAEAVTEEAKWSTVNIREGIFRSRSSNREGALLTVYLVSGAHVGL